jgi:outer membrane receptor protein involved in Fe transport
MHTSRRPACAAAALGLLIALSGLRAAAQEPPPIVANLSLDELEKLRVATTSVAEKPIREQPGIVTLITEREIASMGAQDLMDILEIVPGFSFGSDVDGVIGADFRGLWAYEGKILLLVDGIPVNDGLYGTLQMGHHYSAQQIKQVEIVRGPGSARYGGNAELAVIKVTTKGAEQNGGFAVVQPEVASGRVGTNVEGGVGYSLDNGWRWSFSGRYENFIRSDQTYTSLAGQTVDMKARSTMTPSMVSGSVGWNDLDIHLLYDNYQFDNPIGFGNPGLQTTPWSETFRSLVGSVKYDVKAASNLTISPRVTIEEQHPWWLHTSVGQGDFELKYNKWTVDVPTVLAIDERKHLLAGVTGYFEETTALQTSPFFGQLAPLNFFGSTDNVGYHYGAVYAQFDVDTDWGNVSIGGRFEGHDYAGSQFVPRIGVTRAWKRFHAKALFDQAFRTPNVETIQQRLSGASVTYEKSTSYQAEVGVRVSEHVTATANFYDIRVERPLAFTVQSNTMFGYVNGSPISTHGVELEARYASDEATVYAGYSYYTAGEQLSESLGLYGSSVPGLNLALPAHKLSFSGSYRLGPRVLWAIDGARGSERQAYVYPGIEQALPPQTDVNTRLEYRAGSVTLAAAVRNLLNESLLIAQPYNGGGAPLPLLGRSFMITLGYRFAK